MCTEKNSKTLLEILCTTEGDGNYSNIQESKVVNDFPEYITTENTKVIQSEFTLNNIDAAYETENLEDLFLLNIAQLYLKLESQFMIPASTIQYIVTEFCNIHEQGQEIIQNNIKKCLLEENMSEGLANSILREAFENDPFLKSNNILNTDYKRKTFYKNNFAYVNPIEIRLPSESSEKIHFHYVPIEETVKCLFRDKNLEGKFSYERAARDDEILRDITDGKVFLDNTFLKENLKSLYFILFQDAFQTVNPLGAAKTKYKVIGISVSAIFLTIYDLTQTL